MNEDIYYSIQEVSKTLKVAYLTVYRWIRLKKLNAYKVGRQHRVKKNDLELFIQKQKI